MNMVKAIDTNSIFRYFIGIVPDKHFLLCDAFKCFRSTMNHISNIKEILSVILSWPFAAIVIT
jgi:hypothetical protein